MDAGIFWQFVVKLDGDDACWIWMGAKNNGYGVCRFQGKDQYAHRVSWQIIFGIIPFAIKVLHSCDNPPCVRPSHLFLGTQLDNVHDMVSKGRARKKKGLIHVVQIHSQ